MSVSNSLDELIAANDGIDKRMKEVSQFTQTMHEAMDQVQESVGDIVPISKTVHKVALNIKLLAFNAAIEAAHAGSQGAAFSVVADEVRQLAESSAHAADETSELIENSQNKIMKAIEISEKIRSEFTSIFTDIEKLQQSIVMNLQAMKDGVALSSQNETKTVELVYDPEKMSTSVESIDEQHKKLIDMINELDHACKTGKGKEEIATILKFLGEYAVNHFKHEEGVMDDKKCPKAEENKQAHAAFLQKYTDWKKKYDESGASLSMVAELNDSLQKWLVKHICGIDICLRQCKKTIEGVPMSRTQSTAQLQPSMQNF